MRLLPEGLLVLEPRHAVLYEAWSATESRLLSVASSDASDASPLVELGRKAMRLGRHREGLSALSRAEERVSHDPSAAVELFELYSDLLGGLAGELRETLGAEILDGMRRSATTSESVARQALAEGEYYARSNPLRAVTALHRATGSDAVRTASVAGDLAGIVAERQVRKLVGIHGKALVASFERQASSARDRALRDGDVAGALQEVGLRYPATEESLRSLELAAGAYEASGRLGEAVSLRERLVRGEAEGSGHWRQRLGLARALVGWGQRERARLHAEAIVRRGVWPAGDGVEDRPDTATLGEARGLLAELVAAGGVSSTAVDVPAGPYEVSWEYEIKPGPESGVMVLSDRRTDGSRLEQPLFVSGREGLWALRRDGKGVLWNRRIELRSPLRPTVPVLLLDGVVVIGEGSRVVALDPGDGRELWQTRFVSRPQVREPSLLAAVYHGSEIHFLPRNFQVVRLDRVGGMILVETLHTQHLLAPEDGYLASTVDVPRNGRDVSFLVGVAPASVGTLSGAPHEVRAWDLVAGVPLKGLVQKPMVEAVGPGGRWFEALVSLPNRRVGLADLRAGELRWASANSAPTAGRRTVCRLGSLLVVGTWDARLVGLRAGDGSVAWEEKLGSSTTDAACEVVAVGGDALVRSERRLLRVRADGSIVWEHVAAAGSRFDEVVVTRDRAIVVGSDGRAEGSAGFVQGVDLSDGRAEAATKLSGDERPGRMTVVADPEGLLVVGAERVRFYGGR
jgi:outer membrane protein assembly factor BamB